MFEQFFQIAVEIFGEDEAWMLKPALAEAFAHRKSKELVFIQLGDRFPEAERCVRKWLQKLSSKKMDPEERDRLSGINNISLAVFIASKGTQHQALIQFSYFDGWHIAHRVEIHPRR